MREFHEGPHVNCDRRRGLRAKGGDCLGKREFVEQCEVPDHIKSSLYVQGDGFDLMPDIEHLHPLLGEQKQQHIQGRVTWSETKLMIGNQAIGEEEGFNV